MSLLSARGLSVAPPAEGSEPAEAPIRDLALEVAAGEWLALTGANGCGKTSLLLALSGLWPVRSGEVLLDGRPFGPRVPRQERADVAVILQDPSCQLLQRSVREELCFTVRNLGWPEEEIVPALARWSARFGLGSELERDPHELSAGRQQLVLLAAALMARPRLLLADEPAAHLDASSRRLALEILRGEVGRGLAAVWVTQDPDERQAADRVLDLTGGDLPGPETESAPNDPATEPLMTLSITPPEQADGPRISVSATTTLEVGRWGVTAVEGPNGAGKSVLLAVAAGILALDQVRIAGGALPGLPPILASQYPELEIFEERAGDEAVYAAVNRGVPREEALARAARLCDLLGLGGTRFLGRRTWSLSGGEKRLLSLVSALIAPTSLLVLDEPTAGLDGRRRGVLAGLVLGVAAGAAVLAASQDSVWLRRLGGRRMTLGEQGMAITGKSQQKNGLTGTCREA